MSFSYNPLKHIDIVDDGDPDTYIVYCHGCGNDRIRIDRWEPTETAFAKIWRHIYESHERGAEDFADWSIY